MLRGGSSSHAAVRTRRLRLDPEPAARRAAIPGERDDGLRGRVRPCDRITTWVSVPRCVDLQICADPGVFAGTVADDVPGASPPSHRGNAGRRAELLGDARLAFVVVGERRLASPHRIAPRRRERTRPVGALTPRQRPRTQKQPPASADGCPLVKVTCVSAGQSGGGGGNRTGWEWCGAVGGGA